MDAERTPWGNPEFLAKFGSIVIAVDEYLDSPHATRR
jgi:hypothetical protein